MNKYSSISLKVKEALNYTSAKNGFINPVEEKTEKNIVVVWQRSIGWRVDEIKYVYSRSESNTIFIGFIISIINIPGQKLKINSNSLGLIANENNGLFKIPFSVVIGVPLALEIYLNKIDKLLLSNLSWFDKGYSSPEEMLDTIKRQDMVGVKIGSKAYIEIVNALNHIRGNPRQTGACR